MLSVFLLAWHAVTCYGSLGDVYYALTLHRWGRIYCHLLSSIVVEAIEIRNFELFTEPISAWGLLETHAAMVLRDILRCSIRGRADAPQIAPFHRPLRRRFLSNVAQRKGHRRRWNGEGASTKFTGAPTLFSIPWTDYVWQAANPTEFLRCFHLFISPTTFYKNKKIGEKYSR